ncbi:MAG TPA: hypothetical protein PKD05_00520 [Candidatus Melainabacteria bacterium]|nr:hypothetical protein [Candidatus Melainabacteria bacterium]
MAAQESGDAYGNAPGAKSRDREGATRAGSAPGASVEARTSGEPEGATDLPGRRRQSRGPSHRPQRRRKTQSTRGGNQPAGKRPQEQNTPPPEGGGEKLETTGLRTKRTTAD